MYDAVPVPYDFEAQGNTNMQNREQNNLWWKRNRKCAILSLVLVGLGTVVATVVTSVFWSLMNDGYDIDQNEVISPNTTSTTSNTTSTIGTPVPDVYSTADTVSTMFFLFSLLLLFG